MTPPQVGITELREERFAAVAPVVAKIYENSFPPQEREPFTQTFDGADTHVVLGATCDGQLAGFADVLEIGNSEALLRYLAVAADHRSHGIGRALLDDIVRRWPGRFSRIVFEVESPAHAPDPHLAARRIQFYERWGAHQVRCIDGYFYPSPLDPAQRLPVLLFERHDAPGCLASDPLRDTLTRLYEHYYGPDAAGLHLRELLRRVIC